MGLGASKPATSQQPAINIPQVRLSGNRRKVARLVGKKCEIACTIGGQETVVLWDTGAQVSLLPRKWLKEHLPFEVIHPISDLLPEGYLQLTAANKTPIPYLGYVELVVALNRAQQVLVPFLITDSDSDDVILGYNVIIEVVLDLPPRMNDITAVLADILPTHPRSTITAIVKLIKTQDQISPCQVKSGRTVRCIASGTSVISCKVHVGDLQDSIALLEPSMIPTLVDTLDIQPAVVEIGKGKYSRVEVAVTNLTKSNLYIPRQTTIALLEPISGIQDIQHPTSNVLRSEHSATLNQVKSSIPQEDWLSNFNLDHIPVTQRAAVLEMLKTERGAFSIGDEDIGLINDLHMKINLSDDIPVQKNYMSIPRPLLREVKEYINDLLKKNWIRKSSSPYSSPVVCVRKKDGSLRLCIDYRALNAKTIPDRQPIPRIQDVLDSLGGNQWFSTLDQGKAYHQGFVTEECKHMTAFVTPWGLYEWNRIPSA